LDIRKFRKWEVVHSCLVISNRRIQRGIPKKWKLDCWLLILLVVAVASAFDLRFRRSDKKSHFDLDIRKFRKWEVVDACLVISYWRIQRQSSRKGEAGLLIVDFACCWRCVGIQWVRFWRCMGNETLRAIRVSERWSSEVAANMPLNISHHGRRSRTCRRSSCQRFHLLVIEIFVDFHVYRYFRRNPQFN